MNRLLLVAVVFTVSLVGIWSCKNIQKGVKNANLYSVQDDVTLGKQVADEIASKPNEYPLLPEAGNEQAYAYVRNIVQKLLRTGNVENASVFKWQVKIIKDDKTQNAFCTPGGYIYVYTGLMKFLDSENQLAGVMGHEMGHAAKRHSTRQLTKVMGVAFLADMLAAASGPKNAETKGKIAEVTAAIIGLKFSREHEEEADLASVKYLCGTDYIASGAADFFQKIKSQPHPPVFLSTHPDPANREATIKANASGCKGTKNFSTEYQKFKLLLK